MKHFKFVLLVFASIFFWGKVAARENEMPVKNDTITLAQAYMNLYLTEIYFDTLSRDRISKILAFEKDEIGKIKDSTFINKNETLFYFTKSLFYLNQTKFLTQARREFNRNILRRLKSVFGQAIESYNSASIDYKTFEEEKNDFYEMIEFNKESNSNLKLNIWKLKNEFNTQFNEDIYPDFKRIFNRAKRTNEFDFDSLEYFTNLYDMPLSMAILENNEEIDFFSPESNYISPFYTADNRLELISRYLQLKYLATEPVRSPRSFNTEILYESYDDFMMRLQFEDDEFIKKELTPEVCALLLKQLKSKFPPRGAEKGREEDALAFVGAPLLSDEEFYFFPNPAPQASSSLILRNFKPGLATLKQVDLFLKNNLEKVGYKKQLHYYYDMDGFALTTSLEKFKLDGSSVPADQRFTENLGGEGKFSYFEIFKSIFFDVESEYRMFAFIIASKAATMSNEVMTVSFAEEILKNSYNSLPKALKDRVLANKTLSIFVYHFHQNDIGQVPELDLSEELTVQDHLKNAGLTQIIQ